MGDSRRQFKVRLLLGSLVYLSGLVAFCGGVTFGILETLYALIEEFGRTAMLAAKERGGSIVVAALSGQIHAPLKKS